MSIEQQSEQYLRELAAAQPIEGALLECPKGDWQLDGVAIPIGPDGTRLIVLPETATLGEIRFEGGEPVEKRIGRIVDGFKPAMPAPDGWSPSTSFVCFGVDNATRGQVMTFRGSSYGARHLFNSVNGSFVRLGCHQHPVVTLATTTKMRSGNKVVDPVFRIVGWMPRESILGGGAVAALPAKEPGTLPPLPQGRMTITTGLDALRGEPAGERPFAPLTGDDDIPF